MMKSGVICIGETLVDFVPTDDTNLVYQKSPGGAPANVAVGVARLGLSSYFIGKVGNDVLGRYLNDTLTGYRVDTRDLTVTNEAKTGLVFITLSNKAERSFDFYITPSADAFLTIDDIKEEIFETAKIFHFGSISLIQEPSKTATLKALEFAKKHNLLVSYDPNLRLSLWPSEVIALNTIKSVLKFIDVLKISEEELLFLTDRKESDFKSAAAKLLATYTNIKVAAITMGDKGSYLFHNSKVIKIEPFPIDAIDTTGAGDAFVAGLLFKFHRFNTIHKQLSVEVLEEIGEFASICGGLAVSSKGAMSALPTLRHVTSILEQSSISFRTTNEWNIEIWEQVRAIYYEVFGRHGGKPERIIENMFKHKLCSLHIAQLHSETVGFALTGLVRGNETVLIDYLAVSHKYRNKGYGKRMVAYLKDWATNQLGLDSMLIEVEFDESSEGNERVRFWEKCGFIRTDYIHHYKVVPEPYQAMYYKVKPNSTLPTNGESLFKYIEVFHRKSFRGQA